MSAPLELEIFLRAVARELDVSLLPEFRFHPVRQWRYDWALAPLRVAVEYEGGTWTGGGHVRGRKYAEDCQKYNEAARAGWRVYRVTADMMTGAKKRVTLGWLDEAIREAREAVK